MNPLYMITAEEPNGIIQGIENPNKLFYLGVQFHSEMLMYCRDIRRLFKGLITAAKQGYAKELIRFTTF